MPNIEFHPKQVKYARVNATADGDNILVAAPAANEAIVVLGYSLRLVGAGAFIVRSGAAGSIHLEEVGLAAPGQRVAFDLGGSDTGTGAFQCDAGQALVINNFATGDAFGHLTYRVIRVSA